MDNLSGKQHEEFIEFILMYPEDRKMSPLYRKELFTASAFERVLELDTDEILVYGHTHEPLEEKNRVNTGSWVRAGDNCKRNSYVIIDNGEITLDYWM